MTLFSLALRYTFSKKLNVALTIVLLIVSYMAWLLSVAVDKSLQQQIQRNVQGIDMVLGAKGSPMQLILSAVLFSDNPTGNIDIEDFRRIQKHPLVKQSIPLAMGDNVRGYVLVGTEPSFIDHYQAEIKDGKLRLDDHWVVLGSLAAKNLDLDVGDTFHAKHGAGDGKAHDNHEHYKVAAVLKPNNSVLDKLIVCSIESVHQNHKEVPGADEQITAAWIKFKSPMAMMQLPRLVNQSTQMQAALPSIEFNRMMRLSGSGIALINVFSAIFLFLAMYSILVHLYNSVREHLPDLALLRLHGYTLFQLFSLLIYEAFIITGLGAVLSIAFSKLLFVIINSYAQEAIQLPLLSPGEWSMADAQVLLISLLLGVLSAMLPIFIIRRTELLRFLR